MISWVFHAITRLIVPNTRRLLCVAACCGLALACDRAVSNAAEVQPADQAGKPLTFEEDVVPILEARCLKCHGEQVRKAGLDLRRRFSMLKGGDSGAAIVPGKPDESLLIELITEGNMPPKEEGRLDEKQAALLKRWIAAGAP